MSILRLFNNQCHMFSLQKTEDLTMTGVVAVISDVFGAGGGEP